MKYLVNLMALDFLVSSSLLSSRRSHWLHEALISTQAECTDSVSAWRLTYEIRRLSRTYTDPLSEHETVLQTRGFLADFWRSEIERRACSWDIVGAQRLLATASRACTRIAEHASLEVGLYHDYLDSCLRAAANAEYWTSIRTSDELDHLPDQTFEISFRQILHRFMDTSCMPFPQPSEARICRIQELLDLAHAARLRVLHAEGDVCASFHWLCFSRRRLEDSEGVSTLSDVD